MDPRWNLNVSHVTPLDPAVRCSRADRLSPHTAQHPWQTRRQSGFTLIELLVVTSIIALLISILLPVMSAARRTAQGGACLANLRRVGMACLLYMEKSEGRYPPVRLSTIGGETHVNEYGASEPRWQWFLAFELGAIITPPSGTTTSWGDSYSRTMNNNYFVCPSLIGKEAGDIRDGAYGYNYQYLGNSRTDTAPPAYDNFAVSENEIKATDQTVVFADSRGAHPDHGKHSYTLDPPRLATEKNARRFGPNASNGPIAHSPAEARHRGKAVASFADGHAESVTIQMLGYNIGPDGVVIPDGTGTNPTASNRLWNGRGADDPAQRVGP